MLLCLLAVLASFGTPLVAQLANTNGLKKMANAATQAENNRTDATCYEVETAENLIVHNCLKQFPSETQLKQLKKFEILAIQEGNFDELTVDKYISSTTLKRLSLAKCNIQEVQDRLFMTTPNIEILDLSENGLTLLGDEVLKYLLNLVFLNLTANRIHTIQPNCFDSTQRLAYLDLSNNQLTELPKLPNSIKELDASDNRISKLQPTSQQEQTISFPNAEKIDLCHNNIQEITSMLVCPSLRKLCISTTKLLWDNQQIKSSILKQLKDLTVTGYSAKNPLPKALIMLFSRSELEKLIIENFKVKELELPKSLTELSLIRVNVDDSTTPIKAYGQSLRMVDFTGSPNVVSKLAMSKIFFQQESLINVILTECAIENLNWLKRNPAYPVMEIFIGGNSIDCEDKTTKEIVYNSSTYTRIVIHGLESVMCLSGEPWNSKFSTEENKPIGPSEDSTHITKDKEHSGSKYSPIWIAAWVILPIVVILIFVIICVRVYPNLTFCDGCCHQRVPKELCHADNLAMEVCTPDEYENKA